MSDAKPVVHSACVARSSGLWVQMETIKTAPTTDADTSRRGLTANQSAKKEGAVQQDSHTHRQQLDPEDPRHGTTPGFHAGCRLACCRAAISRYEKETKHRKRIGAPRAIPATGAQRRIQALMALGYTSEDLAHEGGWKNRNHVLRILHGQKGRPCAWLERSTHNRVAEMYERLHMTVPKMTGYRKRGRTIALGKGYAPPLAWDDIDRDNAPILCHEMTEVIDEVKVQRVLDRRPQRDLNRSERDAVLDRWDGTQAELNRLTGWNVDRLLKERKAA